jgi:hypothetical protein
MPLFHVQDDDRPLWVMAKDFDQAVTRWRGFVAAENHIPPREVDGPTGVQKICEDDEFIGEEK